MSTAPQFPPDYRDRGPREVPRGASRKRPLWKSVLLWAGIVVGSLILLVVVAGFVALHSTAVHNYVLRVAQQKASTALGTNVSLRDFTLRFSGISPSVDLYDLSIAGANPYPTPPLATAKHLHVAVTITSLLRRKWYVEDLTLASPAVRMQVGRDGQSNLPKPQSSGGKTNTNIFDLGVRHARIENGEVFYNDRKASLAADLHEVNFQSSYNTLQRSYSGTLRYRDGHLIMQNYAPVPHELDAEFVATPDTFTLKSAVLRSGNSTFEVNASVRDYSNPTIEGQYRASLDATEFRRILENSQLPAGVINLSGKLAYHNEPGRPLLELVTVDGDLGSKRLLATASNMRVAINDLAASYTVANGNLAVPDLRAGLLGGHLSAGLVMRNLAGNSRSHLTAALQGISLQALQSLKSTQSVKQLGLSGALNARADATWGKTMDDLRARADATVNARMAGNGNANPVPVNSSLHALYDARHKQLNLNNSFIRTPQTTLTMNGAVSDHSALQVNLQANDLHEFEGIAAVLRPNQRPVGIYGTASLQATVTGPTDAPRISGQLNATNMKIKGVAVPLLRAGLDFNPSQASLRNGELDLGQHGRVTFNGSAGLQHWSFTNTSPVQLGLNATQLDLGNLSRGAGVQEPVSGFLNASIAMHGSEENPNGAGKLTLTKAKIKDEPLKSLTLQFKANGETLVSDLNAQTQAGSASAKLTLRPKQKAYEAEVQANGIQIAKLETVQKRNMAISGAVNLSASGKGTFDNPSLNATLEIPQLDVRGQKISNLNFQTSLANHLAKFDLRSQVINTAISGHGTVNLSGDYYADAALDTQVIPFDPLVAVYAPSQAGNVGGQTELHATLRGPLKEKTRVEAHITIPQLAVHYKNAVQIAAAGPIRADYVNGVLQVPRAALRGTGTDLQFQGTVPVTSNAPASLLLRGTVDLQLAQMFDPEISSSGQIRFDIDSYGKRENPNVHGQVKIVNANITTGTVPLGLQNGNGVLTLLQDRLQITQFKGTVGGGDFNASGAVVYRPSLRFDVAFAGEETHVLYNNIRGTFNTKLALAGNMDSAQLQGQVNVVQLQFTPAFELMDFMGALGGADSTPPPVGGFEQALRLNVGIDSTAGVNLVSRTMSLQAAANLRLTGTAAQPVILGRVNLSGGDLIFRGNRYVLQGGTLDFVNPSQTQPVVNVSVNTQVQQYNVQMHFWGPADHLHTNYSSDPALPPSDIINLIAFGKTQEYSAANPNPPGNLAAEQFVASQVAGKVTSRFEKVAGLSQFSVDPLLGAGQGESPGARITVQQRVTGKIFVTFSTDVTSTQNSVIKLEYQQSRRVSYSGTRDQNGGFGFDRRIHKEW